jgi:hypothetical protein
MINHLILLSEEQDLHVTDGKLISGHRKIAIDIRLLPMEDSTWEAQIIIAACAENTQRIAELKEFVKVW